MKKISRRTFLNVMGAAGAAGALAACGGSSSGSSAAGASSAAAGGSSAAAGGDVTIRITWWGGQSRHEYTQQLLDKYTELNPSVHFQATPSGWDGYFEKLATDTATGGMADIVQMDYMYISTYAKNGSLADLSSYSSDGTLDTSTIDEALLGSGTIDGKLVGIPLASTLLAFIYKPLRPGESRRRAAPERLDLGRFQVHLPDGQGNDRQVRFWRVGLHRHQPAQLLGPPVWRVPLCGGQQEPWL